ncbi:di-N-acetylchitobiase-like [Mizuhopecten yessoensis]|uniref:Di-N-acetylchitobiase n=1 Tax=Mizuhopecten yessoensis TaxID=6573 RepID=A0A210Q3C4_MIZYE|nr:di-N-acetylchitobiase-like [Mizuhopecten yessoensis]OWF43230.1 Di-N-acetylchitobiase [Mizuhopecten yessoensis]
MGRLQAICLLICCCFSEVTFGTSSALPCQCESRDLCKPMPRAQPKKNMEAYVVTEGKSPYDKWHWDHITMVLNEGADNDKLMCHAHSLGVGYTIMEEMPVYDNYTNNSNYSDWVEKIGNRATSMYADGVAVNLLSLMGQCQVDAQHVDIVTDAVAQVYRKIKTEGWPKLFCIVPWMPPCYQGQCHLTSEIIKYCDYFVTNPDSFITSCNLQCRAQATIPKGRMVLGIDEYLSVGVPKSKMLMGVPWHGYDFKCDTMVTTQHSTRICMLAKKNGTNECDFKGSRTRQSLGEIMSNYPKQFEKHNWDGLQEAPYFTTNFQNETVNETHAVWFEGIDSLLDKYQTVKETGLEGVVVWTADDLTIEATDDEIGLIWNWMVHTLFLTGTTVKTERIDMAGKAAGIGVGCFLGGCLFGFIITCIAYNKRIKKMRIRRPFEKDDLSADDFHDDDKL